MARKKTRARNTYPDDPVTKYAVAVVKKKIMAGPLVRAGCARHLDDLKNGHKRGLYWDIDAVYRAIGYFRDVLRLNGGEHEGVPFELEPPQAFIIGSLFGWKTEDGYRRFRVAFVEMGKGNGKSPLAAGVGLYLLTADDEPRAEVYAAATKKDQAMVLFRDAVAMVDQSPLLAESIRKIGGATPWNLVYQDTASFFRALASDDGQSGPRPHGALLDEIHEHPNDTMVELVRAGTKGRRQALIFMITNSGTDKTSVCWRYHEYTERVVRRQVEDDSFFGYVCSLDKGDDWKDEKVWPKANPLIGVSITLKYLREQVREAKGMPAKQSKVRRLNFCEWVEAANPWIEQEAWESIEGEFDLESLAGTDCYGGLDLSGKNDLTAFTITFPGDKLRSFTWFWTPNDTILAREDRDRVPYALWRDQGFLEATPGKSIDYAFVAKKIGDIAAKFNIRELAFDRYRMPDLMNELSDANIEHFEATKDDEEDARTSGIRCVPFGQGFASMGPAVDTLETAVLNDVLLVQKNPVMTMCSANAVLVQDPAGNRKFDKRKGKSTGRIDGMISLAMSVHRAQNKPEVKPSVYETRGIRRL